MAQLASIRQKSGHVSRGSAGEYQQISSKVWHGSDTTLIAESEEELKSLLMKVKGE